MLLRKFIFSHPKGTNFQEFLRGSNALTIKPVKEIILNIEERR